MGEASRAIFETGEISWKKAKDSVVLDTARLMAEQPDLLTRYGVQRQGSRAAVRLIHSYHTNVATPNQPDPHRQPDMRSCRWGVFLFERTHHVERFSHHPAGTRTNFHRQGSREETGKRLPEKDDQFTITSQVQNRTAGCHILSMRACGRNRAARFVNIPIRLLFNDPDLNFRAEYSLFDRRRAGQSVLATVRAASGRRSRGFSHCRVHRRRVVRWRRTVPANPMAG